jgi:hypothetical protein
MLKHEFASLSLACQADITSDAPTTQNTKNPLIQRPSLLLPSPTLRHDLESLAYVLMYFLRGALPWQRLKAATKKQKHEH